MKTRIIVVAVIIFLAAISVLTKQTPQMLQLSGKVIEADLQNRTVAVITQTKDIEEFIIDKEAVIKGVRQVSITDIKKGVNLAVSYQKSWGKKIEKIIAIQEQQKSSPKSVNRKK